MPKNTRLLLIDRNQAESLLGFDDALEAAREAFRLHTLGEGRAFPLVREKLASGSVFGIKSGGVEGRKILGFKAAGFWPGNRALDGEPHQATILLFDPDTGRPSCVIDGNVVTTLRTGAAGGLGLLRLARRDSVRLCVFGTGTQARIQARFALRLMPGLRSLVYVSIDGKPDARFEAAIAPEAAGRGCAVAHAAGRNEAVGQSDVIITATPGTGALFDADAVRPGAHINAVGADTAGKRELPGGLLERSRLFADDVDQARVLGEAQWAKEHPCLALGELLTGKAIFERRPDDITVFDMTGIALQDLTAAQLLLQRATAANTGTWVEWPW
ncbi:MAG: ornithine cyclodeaminase family protein [Candidatus Accumulibacter sp.]|jgi:ornithine cyclodeaminase|nr:ornithine cyclodeaminase family protein [Accumulibacter sp.]